jgi:hypothetical protein
MRCSCRFYRFGCLVLAVNENNEEDAYRKCNVNSFDGFLIDSLVSHEETKLHDDAFTESTRHCKFTLAFTWPHNRLSGSNLQKCGSVQRGDDSLEIRVVLSYQMLDPLACEMAL